MNDGSNCEGVGRGCFPYQTGNFTKHNISGLSKNILLTVNLLTFEGALYALLCIFIE